MSCSASTQDLAAASTTTTTTTPTATRQDNLSAAIVDSYGFYLHDPTDRRARGTASVEESSHNRLQRLSSQWTVEQLRQMEHWWCSDFFLYLRIVKRDGCNSPGTEKRRSCCRCSTTSTRQSSFVAVELAPHLAKSNRDVCLSCRFYQRWEYQLLTHGGCPHDSLRPLLWSFFSGASQQSAAAQEKERHYYSQLVDTDIDRKTADAICRDISRTLPSHCFFSPSSSSSFGQEQLRRVLHAYAAADEEVGYCQGMGFVVAVLLIVAPEEEAFSLFYHSMGLGSLSASPLALRRLYTKEFALLHTLLDILQSQVELLLPSLAAHFTETSVTVSLFAAQWYLTLFSCMLPMPLLLPLWDVVFLKGWPVLMQLAVVLLGDTESMLLQLDMEGILLHLRQLQLPSNDAAALLRRVVATPVGEAVYQL